RVQILEIFWREPPLDLGIARQRSGTRARHVREHAIEAALERQRQRVRVDDLDVRRPHSFAQQVGAMGVELRRYDFRCGISSCQRRSLAAGSGAAVKQARASADQRGNELRSLVLDEDAAFAKRPRSGYVSSDDHARRCQQCSGNKLKAFALQLWFDLDAVEADRGARNTLVVFANCARTLRAELGHPALHQPLGMGEFTRQECNRIANDRFRRKLDLLVGYLPQHRVRKRHRGALLRLLYQLYAFVDCRARRHSRQELQLVDRKPQRGQYLRIQLVQRTRRCCGDDLVQPRTPAQNTHDELRRQSAIGEAKLFEFLRVQQLEKLASPIALWRRSSSWVFCAGVLG